MPSNYAPVTLVKILYSPASGRLAFIQRYKRISSNNCVIAREIMFHEFSYDANETPAPLSRAPVARIRHLSSRSTCLWSLKAPLGKQILPRRWLTIAQWKYVKLERVHALPPQMLRQQSDVSLYLSLSSGFPFIFASSNSIRDDRTAYSSPRLTWARYKVPFRK